jgi:two-component system OmpR family sensor kinase
VLFSLVILTFSGVIYYNTQKELMFERQNSKLKNDSSKLIKQLEIIHNNFHDDIKYPRFKEFNSAIYDSSGKLIFSTLKEKNVNLNSTIYNINDKIHYIRLLNSFYLGAMYVVIEIKDTTLKYFFTPNVILLGFILFSILVTAGYFLAKLMLKPMRNSLYLLDRFIKDTTHELNTPITSIMTNVEMIDRGVMIDKNLKKLRRIEVAAKTISHIYEDLTFVALGNKTERKDENIDLKSLLQERIEFFTTMADSKHITIYDDLKNSTIFIDRTKISRVIDNLLSNAIKYNKNKGFIKVSCSDKKIVIEDSGIGIKKEHLTEICSRYSRFNESEGGFGIGLSIVQAITKEYNISIEFDSELGKGTKVTLKW